MQLHLDKKQKTALFEQAREQLLTALHTGKLRPGDRLPSVRQVALRNGVNIKTAFSVYQRLRDEGYVDLRVGSGAYVSDRERVDLDQAYCLAILRLIKSNLSQATHLKLDQHDYAKLVHSFVERSRRKAPRVTVIECNKEQINLFAFEISERLHVLVSTILLDQLEHPDRRSAKLLGRTDYFVTTDYHFKQVKELISRYDKRVLQLRLNPGFVSGLVAAARRGRLLMLVSNTEFFPAFRHSLLSIGTPSAVLDNISAVDDTNLARVRAASSQVRSVYVSAICDPRVCSAIPDRVQVLEFDSTLSLESIEGLEAAMLFHG